MKKIATITFHRAQNYGSVLQTYALQKFIIKLGEDAKKDISYQVVDLNSHSQQELYKRYKQGHGLKAVIKNIVTCLYSKSMQEKETKFATFLEKELCLTERYQNSCEVQQQLKDIDCFIAGSDQIWNVRAKDFDDFYFLDFAKNAKKISYAASFGPLPIDWNQYDSEKYTMLLDEFDAISVREDASADNVKTLIEKECQVHVDPTLLLNVEEWRNIQSEANYNNGEYILLYCLEPSKKQLKMAEEVARKLDLPIVVLRYNNKNDMINSFVKKYDAGPKDFLSYIDHARLVLTSSFHGTLFSIIYRKPFYVFNGMEDNRISSILLKTKLCERSVKGFDEIDKVSVKPLNSELIEEFIQKERMRSQAYLTKALNI